MQVTKDPIGHKGARLTSQVSLPGRYLVYVPNGSMNGISRKLPDTERARLKKILKEVLPDDAGVIVRTAAEGATEEQLTLDVQRLTAQWAEISHAVESVQAPALLHSEPDLLIKIVRDVFNEDFQKLVIEGDDALETISSLPRRRRARPADRLERYESEVDSFDEYRISEQIEKALERKVWLPSGGSLIVDRTEAMTVVDVNTGKFVGSGGNLEETVTKNNLEAAEEIVRQLRLRDIGGIIVVDFIDMVLESNRDLVLRRLVECLSRDRTKHQVAEVTSLGLVQMTRKKLGLGLLESFSETCEVCAGRGLIVHHDPVFKHRAQQVENGNGNGGNGGGSRARRAAAADAAAAAAARRRRTATARTAPTRSPRTCATRSPRSPRAPCTRTPTTRARSPASSRTIASRHGRAGGGGRGRGRRRDPRHPGGEGARARSAASAPRMRSRSSVRCSRRSPSRASPATVAPRRSRRAGSSGAVVEHRRDRLRRSSSARSGVSRPASACRSAVTRSPAACSRRSSSRPVTGHGAQRDQVVAAAQRVVVVVVVEPALRDAGRRGERVQLVERLVAHQVPPDRAVCGPDGSSMRITVARLARRSGSTHGEA